MKEKIEELEKIKKFLNNTEGFELFTRNKNLKINGCASLNLDGSVSVFEGDSNGKDDMTMDYETFINNYDYHVAHENEPDLKLYFSPPTFKDIVYVHSETLAYNIANRLYQDGSEDIDSNMVYSLVKESINSEDEKVIDEVYQATLNLLKTKYTITIDEDRDIKI